MVAEAVSAYRHGVDKCVRGARAPQILAREVLTIRNAAFYAASVEAFARFGPDRVPTATMPIASPVSRVTRLVEPQLDQVEEQIVQQAAAFDSAIEGYVAYAIGGRGKRLRPLVALLAGGATSQINPAHVDLAVIVELIHIATLVHDDVMDEAERRRARPTVNARWGNTLSVLLGDCLFAHALNLSTRFDNSAIGRVIARTASEICSGEMIQTQRRFDLKLGVEDYLRIVKMKTGSLFATAAELGATISEADPNAIELLKNFGMRIGTAYQIYDDCLDIAGEEATTGKTLGSDLRKGKFTLPVLFFLRGASEFDRERCAGLILDGRCDEVADLLKNRCGNGALDESIAVGSDLIAEAQSGIEPLPTNAHVAGLLDLGEALREMFEQLRV